MQHLRTTYQLGFRLGNTLKKTFLKIKISLVVVRTEKCKSIQVTVCKCDRPAISCLVANGGRSVGFDSLFIVSPIACEFFVFGPVFIQSFVSFLVFQSSR